MLQTHPRRGGPGPGTKPEPSHLSKLPVGGWGDSPLLPWWRPLAVSITSAWSGLICKECWPAARFGKKSTQCLPMSQLQARGRGGREKLGSPVMQ